MRQSYNKKQLVHYLKQYMSGRKEVPTREKFFNSMPFSSQPVIKRFGTWSNYVKAAGFKPNLPGKSNFRFTQEELVEYLIQQIIRTGKETFKKIDFFKSVPFSLKLIRSRFGNWSNYLNIVGLKPANKPKYTQQEIITAYKIYYERVGYISIMLACGDKHLPCPTIVADRFGSFNKMLVKAGIPINEQNGIRNRLPKPISFDVDALWEEIYKHRSGRKKLPRRYTDSDLLEYLQVCYQKNGVVTEKLLNDDPLFPHMSTYRNQFKSLTIAKAVAGVPVTKGQQHYTVAKDGYICHSAFEAKIDNWLFDADIKHTHQVNYPESNFVADFGIGSNLVEAAGMTSQKYQQRLKEKIAHAKLYNVRVIVADMKTTQTEFINSILEI